MNSWKQEIRNREREIQKKSEGDLNIIIIQVLKIIEPAQGTDSVLIKFTQEFGICGVFELFSMKIKLESAQNWL